MGQMGYVYLAKWRNQDVAIKLSDSGTSITSEVNVLKSFAKVQGSVLGPSLLDVDDWGRKSGTVFFYVMEYIKGPDFMTFIEQKGILMASGFNLAITNRFRKIASKWLGLWGFKTRKLNCNRSTCKNSLY